METRKITVISNKGQYKKVFETSATTLGELKADMRSVGINYDGMSFLEGITRTELVDDASQLPTNVMYRGETTNNLVFYLTATDKKIKSGISRQEAYDVIRASQQLQDAVKQEFGRNFTQVSTDNLVWVITNFTPADDTPLCPCCETVEYDDMSKVDLLAHFLYVNGCISYKQYNAVTSGGEQEDEEVYSSDELDEMFDFVQE